MEYYWYIVLYFWPTVNALFHVLDAIDEAHMIASNFRRWAWNRMWGIVIVVVSVWTITNVVESKTSWHWTIASVKCFIECFIITDCVHGLGRVSEEVISQDQAVLKKVLYNAYWAAIFAFYDPKFSAVIIAFVAFWLGELMLEIVVDECYSLWHRRDKKPPRYKPTVMYGLWKVAAVLRSSNNGYRTDQFTAVTMCDVDEFEDSFSILVVEVRRRNRIWRSLILWRVSLLDGTQKKIHEYQLISKRTIGRPFARVGNDISIESFQSRGLVIVVQKWRVRPVVFLYDQRCGKSASYESRVSGIRYFDKIVDFACLRRDYDADGSIRGWRVRIVDHRKEMCECHPDQFLWRSVIRISTIDFGGQKPVLVSQEEIVFGRCSRSWTQVLRSRNLFAIREFRTDDGPIIMFNRLTCTFCRLPDFNALKRLDRPLALYYYTPTLGDPLKMMGDYRWFPTDLTEKGCVYVYKNGVVVRTDFEPPSMLRGALEALFQAEPSLRIGMSADQFRRLTGIGGMESQF